MTYDINDSDKRRRESRRGARLAALDEERARIAEVVEDARKAGTLMVGETTPRPERDGEILRATRARIGLVASARVTARRMGDFA